MLLLALAFLVPWGLSGLLTAVLLRLAPRLGLVDEPNARKVHTQRTPRGGGLAIYAGVAAGLLLLPAEHGAVTAIVLLGLALVLLGLVDDFRPLPWQLRLAVQMAVAVGAVCILPSERSWVGQLLGVLWIVGLTNAFNMLDNMDALSGGVAWIAAGFFALATLLRPEEDGTGLVPLSYVLLMGAVTGFLWFNRPPARIFMGDAGSTFLGFYLGTSSLRNFLPGENLSLPNILPVCILAVPWYDLTTVVLLRLWQGRSPFHADKQHLSHRLVHLGLRPAAAVGVIGLLALASGSSALVLQQGSAPVAPWVGVQLACCWLALAALEYWPFFRSEQS